MTLMKKGLRIAIALGITALVVVLVVLVSRNSNSMRIQTACTGLEVSILDSASLGFVSVEDVKRYIDEGYGVYLGQRMDSVNLKKIESAIEGRSAVGTTQAYMTLDGILHVEITQREPMVLFKTKDGGFYADEKGFLFPMRDDFSKEVTVIEGEIPINGDSGYKGEPKTEEERQWLSGMLDLIRYIKNDKFWSGNIAKIHLDKEGSIIMTPREGKEKFIFGKPENFVDKFSLMETYYRYIEPEKEKGYYSTVDVRYNGQIICREK